MASRRQYLTLSEIAEYAEISIVDTTEAEDQISQAEEIIDSYVGAQDQFMNPKVRRFGVASSATSTTLVDTSSDSPLLDLDTDYYKGCEVEIIGGTGSGQRRIISASSPTTDSITVVSAWSTTPDSTSAYRIYQLGKFPRHRDVFHDSTTETYYKSIPEAVKRATAAQVQYIIEMGEDFFAGPKAMFDAESLGNYSYSMGDGIGGLESLVSPKARKLLLSAGIVNKKGRITGPNPTLL